MDILQNANSTSISYDSASDTYTIVTKTGIGDWGSCVALITGKIIVLFGLTCKMSFEIYVPTEHKLLVDVNNSPTSGPAWNGNDNDNTSSRVHPGIPITIPANKWTTVEYSFVNNSSDNTYQVALSTWDYYGLDTSNDTAPITYYIRNIQAYISAGGELSMNLKGPTSPSNPTQTTYNMLVTNTTSKQTLTNANTFNVSNLSSTGMTEEGFCNRTYTTSAGSYNYTTKYGVSSGAAVIVQSNSTYGSDLILAGMGVGGDIVGDNVYNAVWNDMVDCIEVPENTMLEYGKCYIYNGKDYIPSTKYLDDGIIGIHSDTAGFYVGSKQGKCLEVAIAGFALAYVDKVYKPGTPLTCGPNGYLTELKEEDIEKNPHKIVATFWKREWSTWWGFNRPQCDDHIVEVKNRMWVKVR